MKPPKDSLLLIDGHAVLYRAFHALPPLKTKDGIQTNAIYGFITTLFKALEDIKPKYWAVAFDMAGPTFRHKAFAGYKASRPDTPPELSAQVPYAYEVAEALNIPVFTKEGFEADDIIGTLAKQAKQHHIPVVIVTGDKDSFQLVDDSTFVYTMKRSITDTMLYDAKGVKEKMGITPSQVPDYKALAGDSSDEIPGIAGIGEKTAVTILEKAESIEKLYELLKKNKDLEGISERIRQKLIEGEDIARQSRELATIDTNVPINLEVNACAIHDYSADKAVAVFQKLEFFSLVKRLPQQIAHDHPVVEQKRDWKFEILTAKDDLERTIKLLSDAPQLAVDTETNDLYGEIVGISLSSHPELGYYIPLVKEHGATLSKDDITDLVKPLLENKTIGKVGHNIKYDLESLQQLTIEATNVVFDTMVAAYILHAHFRTFDFDTVCQRELGYTPIPLSDIVDKKQMNLLVADGEKLAEYAAEDAVLTFRLFQHFKKQLDNEPTLKHVAETFDFPLIPVLKAMETHGVCIDKQQLEQLEKDLDKEISKTQKEIESYAKEPININSPVQLQKLLFEDLQLDKAGIKSTQKGVSTAASELEKLQGLHPVIDLIMKYRELTKLQSTYVRTLPKLVDEKGRIHTQFSQVVAATGRLSSSDPNLQNIPIRSELGNQIRKAFVAPKGYELLSLDYSQFELRIIAHLSDDKQLKQIFLDGRDIHDEVSKKLGVDRRAAKAINFGIIYGLSAFGLSQGLKIDPKTAKQYIDAYFATYPQLAQYLVDTKKIVREKGYVETLYGRRREIPEIQASNAIVRAAAERMAINAPAQGTEADIMKLAMIRTHEWLEHEYSGKSERPYLVLQVHDSLLLETPKDLTQSVGDKIKEIMEKSADLSVPLIVDCSVGTNWGELVKQS